MRQQKPFFKVIISITLLAFAMLACTLTSEPPATLAPRQPNSTLTPQSPVGPQATILPPSTNQPLPSGVTSNLPTNASIADQIASVDNAAMLNTITALTTKFSNRHALASATTYGQSAARDWLIQQFQAIQSSNPQVRIDVYPQRFEYTYQGTKYSGDNVLMVMNGTHPDGGVVIIGAHYDTVNSVNMQNSTVAQPGANDNGSGVAAVLEIARIMAQRPHRATIIFAMFGSEELARYGSAALARDFIQAQRIPLRGVINLDMVGNSIGPSGVHYDNQMRVFSALPNTSSSRNLARLTELAARIYVPEMIINVMDTIDRSGRWGDHQSFSDLNYPAIRLIEQDDDPRYSHNDKDTIARIDAAYLKRTTQVALAIMLVLADGPTPPQIHLDQQTWRLDWTASPDAVSYIVALRRPGSLKYDYELTVQGGTDMTWESFQAYEAVAVAAVDQNGQMGAFSAEWIINPPPLAGQ